MRGSLVERSGFANSPPKLGGADAHQNNIAKPPSLARPGWFPEPFRFGTTPSAPLRNGIFFLNGAATPPNLGGELCILQLSSLASASTPRNFGPGITPSTSP